MKHGGDIYTNKVDIDFSVNLNPDGIPEPVKEAILNSVGRISHYPDPAQKRAIEAIADTAGVGTDCVLAGNGASELILAAVRSIKPAKALLFEPAFSGYMHALSAAGCSVVHHLLSEEKGFAITAEDLKALDEDTELVFICDPSNPAAINMDRDILMQLLDRAEKNKTAVILDESFYHMSDAALTGGDKMRIQPDRYKKLYIIRSLTKLLSIPGVRAGYVLSRPENIRALKAQLPEWNLSVMAEEAICEGLRLVASTDFVNTGIAKIRREREYLSDMLTDAGFTVFESSGPFILFKGADGLYERLLSKGILIRDCSDFPGLDKGYYRIAVRDHKDNEILAAAISHDQNAKNHTLPPARKKEEDLRPDEIEKRSFEIITDELEQAGIFPDEKNAAVILRCIHTTADFEYASTLCFSPDSFDILKNMLRNGATIVTDTNMALSGINKKMLYAHGGKALCFMADEDVAREAAQRGITRAAVSMERAAGLDGNVIFAIGNAPTALMKLYEMMKSGVFRPRFIIGVPVGFVNVVRAKELFLGSDVPYIINRGRKGGSTVAAAICNAALKEC